MIGFEVLAVVVFFVLVDFFAVLVDFDDFDDFDVLGVVITRPSGRLPRFVPFTGVGFGVGFLIG
jgi:hypothetical protein